MDPPAFAEETGLLQTSLACPGGASGLCARLSVPPDAKAAESNLPPLSFVCVCVVPLAPLLSVAIFVVPPPPHPPQHFVKWLLGEYLLSPSFRCFGRKQGWQKCDGGRGLFVRLD